MNDPNKPAGSPGDFKMETASEREARQLKANDLQAAERDFQIEQNRIAAQRSATEEKRRQFEAAKKVKPPTKVMHLLVAKDTPAVPRQSPVFKVVGMFSTREKLAEHLGPAAMAYSEAGKTIGVVEFDLSVKVDQPAVGP